MTYDALKSALVAMTRKQSMLLADAAQVPRSTVDKIRYGQTSSPRITTFELLVIALKKTGRR